MKKKRIDLLDNNRIINKLWRYFRCFIADNKSYLNWAVFKRNTIRTIEKSS